MRLGYNLLSIGEPAEMGAGLWPVFPRSEYDQLGYFSQTVLKKWIELRTEPEEFEYWLDHRTEDEGKECFLLGNALDCILLEGPQAFCDAFVHEPENAPRKPTITQRNAKNPSTETLDSIRYWDAWHDIIKGKTILTNAQWDLVENMDEALRKNERTSDVWRNCRKVNLIAELDGFPCKAEVDSWMDQGEHIGDLKQLKDVSPEGFWDAFYKTYGYRYQATFYLMLAQALGFEKTVFDFWCVKNMAPWTVRVHSFAPEQNDKHAALFDDTREELRSAMMSLSDRLRLNNFQAVPEWELIQVPDYAVRKAQTRGFN